MVVVSGPSDDAREDYYPENVIAHQTEDDKLALLGEGGHRWVVSDTTMEVER